MGRATVERWLVWVGALATIAASIAWLKVPAYTSGYFAKGVSRESHSTLIEHDGNGVIVLLIIPIAIALWPVFVRRPWVTRFAAGLMFGFALLTGFTIGYFYWPAVVLMIAAAVAAGRAKQHETRGPLPQA